MAISAERTLAWLSVIKEFQALSLTDLEAIAQVCNMQPFKVGQNIVRYHDNTDSVFFIIQGGIRVTYNALSGQEVILCDLSGGEMFGELTAIDSQPRSATVVAKTDGLLATMPASAFMNLIYANPKIAEAILKRLTGQIRRLTERVYDFSTLAVRNRIHAELLRLARIHMTTKNEAIISPPPTHVDIANFVSTHREAVTRELNILAKEKLITRTKQMLHVHDVSKLATMVNEVRGE